LLAVPQQRDVEIIEDVGIVGQQLQQELMGSGGSDFWPNQAHSLADPMHVGIDGQDRLGKAEEQQLTNVPVLMLSLFWLSSASSSSTSAIQIKRR
jgi:hypothetical protein